ncbi:rab effector MyRIP-like isoform X1 [Anguilla anguilla]|uniref:rab effector MyRIP-like isoform X1 n=1 Tax=Anguilla anguilla TaxID=7936 RepID=UPI0015AFC960|nr:rab effector MyRIP-like isoform X1 [Anguilla anguilla]XP_035264700.1 rab effector MyRIP-like isoform X1 [Anguilla anguilla]
MLSATPVPNKLDLSRLTDDEAKHVWDVIQRDFDLRKKEEDRLGDLKTKIEKEDTKRELLGTQTSLTDSHCIRCLQPFKFLVNSKRQCLDCQLYTCKACSRYNKKDRGWVCDSCRMARVLKIGTLEWYHENVRSRFKRFGSAKVMRSLYKRLNGERGSQPDLSGIYDSHEEDGLDWPRCKPGHKSKRRLTVNPPDFDLDNEYSSHSPPPPFQQTTEQEGWKGKDLEFTTNRRKSLEKSTRSDEGGYQPHRMKRTRSLSKIGNSNGPQHLLRNEVDTSDEESCGRAPYQSGPLRRHSRAALQEGVGQTAPPITELNRRMSAIEGLLNHLEQKMPVPPRQLEPLTVVQLEEENLRMKLGELKNINENGVSSEDEEARRPPVLREVRRRSSVAPVSHLPFERLLNASSDEIPSDEQKRSMAAALCDITAEFLRTINATEKAMAQFIPPKSNAPCPLTGTDATQADEAYRNLEENVYMTAGKSYDLEKNLQDLEETAKSRYCGNTDSELSELEDKVAKAAVKVQTAESEVSEIENKIAALRAGMSVEKSKRKASVTAQRRRLSLDFPIKTSNDSGFGKTPSAV